MIKTQKRIKYVLSVPLFLFATVALQFAQVQFASAATLTWDGSAGDNKFSTAANWNTNSVPVNGDILNFNTNVATDYEELNNDISNLSVAGINYSGTNSSAAYSISGNTLTVTGDLLSTATSGQWPNRLVISTNVILGADIIVQDVSLMGSGNTLTTNNHTVTISGVCVALPGLIGGGVIQTGVSNSQYSNSIALNANSTGFTGNVIVKSGQVFAPLGSLGTSAGTTTVQDTGSIWLFANANSTWSEPFILSGTGDIALQHSTDDGCSGTDPEDTLTGTFTGPITLQSNFKYNGTDNMTVTGTYTANGHKFETRAGASGILTTPSGTSVAPTEETTYSDDQSAQALSVGANQTATIDGTRGAVNVSTGGTVSGTGTVRTLNVNRGTVAPGHSPGTLTVLESFTLTGGTYEAELKTSAAGEYDQLRVSDPSRTTQTDVYLDTTAVLEVNLYSGYSIKQGDTFTIIDNRQPASQLVSGTFQGLAQGAQFTVGNIMFNISYIGGDGNDVVLTALNTGTDPSAPNTGAAKLLLGNPVLIAVLGASTVALIVGIAIRRQSTR